VGTITALPPELATGAALELFSGDVAGKERKSVTERGRMLGVDVGERYIGIAVSQGRLAVPLSIVEHETRDADLERVAVIVREQEAQVVVVGLPMLMGGEEGDQARRTRRFGDALARRVNVPVIYHDERMSTLQVVGAAGARITGGRGARRGGKARIDDLAAAVILQSYLDTLEPPRELPS
jgi:putative Holliday junction resolvase